MRKFATLLIVLLGAALLHTGAMAGLKAFGSLAMAHPAAHAQSASDVPFCPINSLCPASQEPLLALAKLGLLFLYALAISLIAWLPRVAPFLRAAPFSPYAPPPNHPRFLLSIFKRE